MRKNNKGFMLIETLLVSVFVVSTLIFIYIQFEKVRNSYQTSFSYNTTNGVYGANAILTYLKENGMENLDKRIDEGDAYIDLTNCPGSYLSTTAFCHRLLTDLKVHKIFYVSNDVTNFKSKMDQAAISNKFKSFVRSIKEPDTAGYRLLIEYENEEYATILTTSITPEPSPSPTPTPTPTPTPSSPIKTLSRTTKTSIGYGLDLNVDYVVTKNSDTNKATVTFDVDTISGAFDSSLGASFGVNLESGTSSMYLYMQYNGSNYVASSVNGNIHVVKDIQMTDTTASIPISVMITGVTKSYNVNVSWNDSDLK